ncbi:NnrS family protein [Alcanivorax hongdengensis]|nr:NnrS family protein [Alcanivorax hongdengensis]
MPDSKNHSVILSYPFRLFFLATSLSAMVLVPIWVFAFTHGVSLPLALPPLSWHQHEMLSGFVNAAIAGFLLTAVCNWTRTPPVKGGGLLVLGVLWLTGRVLMAFGFRIPAISAVVDLLFLPVVTFLVAVRVMKARQWRQSPIIVVLMMLWAADMAFHLSANPRFLHAQLLMVSALILVIGGRITPAFTNNWLRVSGRQTVPIRFHPWLDWLGVLLAVMLALSVCVGEQDNPLAGVVALMAALVVLVRVMMWRPLKILGEPLLWILHVGHCWLASGYFLFAWSLYQHSSDSAWVHALGAGAIGTMILGVMTRVTVGHTGNPMRLLKGGVYLYVAVIAAGTVRVWAAMGGLSLPGSWYVAAGLWALAFGGFSILYGPLLWRPRMDGRAG